jgi:hypothetical protein
MTVNDNNNMEKMEAGFAPPPPTVHAVAVTGLTPTSTTTSQPVAVVSQQGGIPMHQQEKQGSKCCKSLLLCFVCTVSVWIIYMFYHIMIIFVHSSLLHYSLSSLPLPSSSISVI